MTPFLEARREKWQVAMIESYKITIILNTTRVCCMYADYILEKIIIYTNKTKKCMIIISRTIEIQ